MAKNQERNQDTCILLAKGTEVKNLKGSSANAITSCRNKYEELCNHTFDRCYTLGCSSRKNIGGAHVLIVTEEYNTGQQHYIIPLCSGCNPAEKGTSKAFKVKKVIAVRVIAFSGKRRDNRKKTNNDDKSDCVVL